FDIAAIQAEIDALDNRVKGQAQISFYQRVHDFVISSTGWQLKNGKQRLPVGERVEALEAARSVLEPLLPGLLPPAMQEQVAKETATLSAEGAPAPLARKLAMLDLAESIPDVALLAEQSKAGLEAAAAA